MFKFFKNNSKEKEQDKISAPTLSKQDKKKEEKCNKQMEFILKDTFSLKLQDEENAPIKTIKTVCDGIMKMRKCNIVLNDFKYNSCKIYTDNEKVYPAIIDNNLLNFLYTVEKFECSNDGNRLNVPIPRYRNEHLRKIKFDTLLRYFGISINHEISNPIYIDLIYLKDKVYKINRNENLLSIYTILLGKATKKEKDFYYIDIHFEDYKFNYNRYTFPIFKNSISYKEYSRYIENIREFVLDNDIDNFKITLQIYGIEQEELSIPDFKKKYLLKMDDDFKKHIQLEEWKETSK